MPRPECTGFFPILPSALLLALRLLHRRPRLYGRLLLLLLLLLLMVVVVLVCGRGRRRGHEHGLASGWPRHRSQLSRLHDHLAHHRGTPHSHRHGSLGHLEKLR